MLVLIDNFDSFTYNIVEAFHGLGIEVIVRRNHTSLEEIEDLAPDYIVIGPGPKKPQDAGISLPCIQHMAGKVPLLGICLGHQAINEAFGGITVRARMPMHGKSTTLTHQQSGLFAGIPQHVEVIRYHSLVADAQAFPDCLEITAVSPEGEIMALRHKTLAVEGVQFHPESILSEYGAKILQNFLENISKNS